MQSAILFAWRQSDKFEVIKWAINYIDEFLWNGKFVEGNSLFEKFLLLQMLKEKNNIFEIFHILCKHLKSIALWLFDVTEKKNLTFKDGFDLFIRLIVLIICQ